MKKYLKLYLKQENMKTIKLSLILIIFTQMSSGQYKSIFGNSSTQWNFIPLCSADGSFTITCEVKGDTFINSYNYKIVYPYSIYKYDSGYLREDTISGKVWFYDKYFNIDYLVVDMSLIKGDSFRVYDDNDKLIYFHVDSIYAVNGLKYIVFSDGYISRCIGSDDEFLKFIEGTGTNGGIFYQKNTDKNTIRSYLMCQEKDGVKVYRNSRLSDTCFYTDLGIKNKKNENEDILVYPNPTNGYITITLNLFSADYYELKVFNSLAQLTHLYKVTSSKYSFSLSNEDTGVNYYIISNNNGFSRTGKIIKL
jgi:hypothetical protein